MDSEIENALLTVNATLGKLHAAATAGAYSFPAVGFALAPADAPGANSELYSPLPIVSLQYAFDSHFSVSAGKFAALLGQESPFTYENLNVQRGIGWGMEPTISRGVQAAYTNGPWSLTLQANDAYYSGSLHAVEGLAGWSPSSNTAVQFAFIIPGANTGPNATTPVGNKAEYDVMYTRQIGKLQLLPYVLIVESPSSSALGYVRSERANAEVFLASWAFSQSFSTAFRYENAADGSSQSDASPNADLVGFGAGSSAESATLTPALRFGNGGVVRLEYSFVRVRASAPFVQNRLGFELGVMH